MNIFMIIVSLFALFLVQAAEPARAELPWLSAKLVVPGCVADRAIVGETMPTQVTDYLKKHTDLGIGMGYCAGWVHEFIQRDCFPNESSVDDVMLLIFEYSEKHPELADNPFASLADSAIEEHWPKCAEKSK